MKRHMFIIPIFILLILILTFPLITNICGFIPAFFSTDETFGTLWDSWRIKYSFQHGISLAHTPFIAYPFGLYPYASGYLAYVWLGLLYTLSIITSPVLTYNLQGLCNFMAMAFFCYLLVYLVTRNYFSAIFSGTIFAFCPYQFSRLWQHLGLTYNQWIPLMLLALILVKERNSRGASILLFFSFFLAFSFDFSVMYFTAIVMLSFLFYSLWCRWKQRQGLAYIRKVVMMGAVVLLILLPQFLPIIANSLRLSSSTAASAHNLYHRSQDDLFTQSARPLSYFLPAPVHPIFGKFTEHFIGTSWYGVSLTEHTLYLGWVPLLLALFAARRWWQARKKEKITFSEYKPQQREIFHIGYFIFLATVAWLFSQPPWWNWFGFKVYMPSFFMYRILPMYRAYCRFGIVVMLAVAVLAGFGLKFILERFKSKKVKLAVTALCCSLVLFEFWNWPPFKVIDVSKAPQVYYWLKDQPGDIVIGEYPLDADSPNEMYKFYQTVHEKRMINGTIPGTPANAFAQTIVKLSEPNTVSVLKGIGVKYVLVHRDGYLQTDLIEPKEEFKRISQNNGLKLVRSFASEECPQKSIMCVRNSGPIDVYEITAEPKKTKDGT